LARAVACSLLSVALCQPHASARMQATNHMLPHAHNHAVTHPRVRTYTRVNQPAALPHKCSSAALQPTAHPHTHAHTHTHTRAHTHRHSHTRPAGTLSCPHQHSAVSAAHGCTRTQHQQQVRAHAHTHTHHQRHLTDCKIDHTHMCTHVQMCSHTHTHTHTRTPTAAAAAACACARQLQRAPHRAMRPQERAQARAGRRRGAKSLC
jgi:hypothetical protein